MEYGREIKEKYLKAFRVLAKEQNFPQQYIDDITMDMMWINPSGGMRISRVARYMFEDFKFETWDFVIKENDMDMSPQNLMLDMDRFINTPYYINLSAFGSVEFIVYDEKIGTAIGLMGDPVKYLKNRKKLSKKG